MKKTETSKTLATAAHQLHLAGRLDEAEVGYRKALREDAGNANAHYLLGTLFLQRGDAAHAVRSIGRAIQISPGFAEMHVNLSVAYQHMDQHAEAADAARRALALQPNNAPALSNLGHALGNLGAHEDALAVYRDYIRLRPTEAYAHVAFGNALFALGRSDAAIQAWEDALTFDPAFVAAHRGIAEALAARGWFHGARAVLENALTLDPENPNTRVQLGLLLIRLGRLAEGWSLQDDARFLASAERIMRRPEPPPYWNGEDLSDKRILIWTEQGLGDEILHAGMIPDVIQRARVVTIACSARLVPIFARSFPSAKVVGYKASEIPATSAKDFDVQIAIASLGRILRRDFSAFPRHSGYLRADADAVARFRKAYERRADGCRIVGISWRSKMPPAAKSAALMNLAPILKTPGVLFVNLQYGDCAAELAAVRENLGVDIFHDATVDPLVDMDLFFAQVGALDLVISSSNTTVHVAGSQNIPVWMFISGGKAAPYYWFLERADSPWYSSVRIFRATEPDSAAAWEIEPAKRIGEALAAWTARELPESTAQ